jgi:hypothetical protein
MKEILELMAKNFPFPSVLMIYDDESGRLLKDGTKFAYDKENVYFCFNNLEQLKEYLSNPPVVVCEDTLLGEVDEEFPY